ncbi:MAG: SPASM domain-containing protein [Nitrospirae bacterium]|nr:SPASM domain-containing protein [Nitrospirota bacterium]
MKSLSAPLRVYWDIAPEKSGGLAAARAMTLAEELAALKVFFVTLGLTGGRRDDTAGVIAALKKGGSRVTVSVPDVETFPGWDAVTGISALDLRPSDAGMLGRLLDEVASSSPKPVEVAVSVVPSRTNTELMLEIFSLAVSRGIRIFNLPNPPITGGGAEEYVLGANERAALKAGLERLLAPLGKDVRLGVHDLFLHQTLALPGLGGRIEYAGCQAGDAIAYIGADGMLYPCASWPTPMGDLKVTPFRDIWSDESRQRLRESLSAAPEDCAACEEAAVCKGGCRGLALALTGRDGRDPGCDR